MLIRWLLLQITVPIATSKTIPRTLLAIVRSLLALSMVGISMTGCGSSSQVPSPSSTGRRIDENATVLPQNDLVNAPDVLFDRDQTIYIVLPEDWESDRELHDTAALQASHQDDDLYIIVLVEEKPDFSVPEPTASADVIIPTPEPLSLDDYADRVLALLSRRLSDVEIDAPTATRSVHHYPARQFILRGQLDGIEAAYLVTAVETDNAYYQIVAWSLPDLFSDHKDRLQQVVQSFREVPHSRPSEQQPQSAPKPPIESDRNSENPDPENPDPENPDPENPDPENPDPENPDPENPDSSIESPEETETTEPSNGDTPAVSDEPSNSSE
jgi:hypothetical protein